MWSSAFDPIKFDWFYLERLRRSARLVSREERLKTDFGSNADFHKSRTRRIINDNQMSQIYESVSISVSFQHGYFYFEPARAYLIYMHESSLLVHLHIPLVFSQSASLYWLPWIVQWAKHFFSLKNHCPKRSFFSFIFWCSSSVRPN